MTANDPQEATGARLAGERVESEERDIEAPNGPQTGAQRLDAPPAPPLQACRASISGRCLAVTQGDPGCATTDGECVHA